MADFFTSIPGQIVKTVNWFLVGGQEKEEDQYASEFNPMNPVREGFIDRPQVQANLHYKPPPKDADMPAGSFGIALMMRPDYQEEYHRRKMHNFLAPKFFTMEKEFMYGKIHQARELNFIDGTFITTRDRSHQPQENDFYKECQRMKM